MNRRTPLLNSPRRRPSITRPTCGTGDPKAPARRCVLDPGHLTRHFADGQSWGEEAERAS